MPHGIPFIFSVAVTLLTKFRKDSWLRELRSEDEVR